VAFTVAGTNTYNLGGLQGADGLNAGANSLSVGSNNTNTDYSGVLAGSGGLTKTGVGTFTLSGSAANTLSGNNTVSGGTLQLNKVAGVDAIAGNLEVASTAALLLSASGQVADTSAVTLSGGTIRRGGNVSEVFGNLNVTAASFLDFGSANAAGTLSFGTYTASALLTVQNFLPGNKLQFATGFDAALLPTGGNLSNANFSFSNGFTTGTEGGYFTITAIPEPSTYVAAAGLLALLLWPLRRRTARTAP
jgi:autotransporter-associated beta strand protein